MHAGVVPLMNPSSDLFNSDVFQHKDLFFNLSTSKVDARGLPYAFHPELVPGKKLGFMVWLPMDQPEAVLQNRLQYLKDASFLGSSSQELTLEFAAVDVARSALAYVKLQFSWHDGGSIDGVVKISGMPIATLASSIWVCICAMNSVALLQTQRPDSIHARLWHDRTHCACSHIRWISLCFSHKNKALFMLVRLEPLQTLFRTSFLVRLCHGRELIVPAHAQGDCPDARRRMATSTFETAGLSRQPNRPALHVQTCLGIGCFPVPHARR
jgi:hypothetical protein